MTMPDQLDPGDLGDPGAPNLDSFGPTPHGAAGQLLGTNDLNKSITTFDLAVTKLAGIVGQLGGERMQAAPIGTGTGMLNPPAPMTSQAAYQAMGGTLGAPASPPAPMTVTRINGQGGWQSMPPPVSPPGSQSPPGGAGGGPSG